MSIAEMLEEARNSDEYWAEAAILDFTSELARLMEEKGVSKKDLAERMGRSPSWITKILSGENNFQIKTMARVARALGAVVHICLAPENARVSWHVQSMPSQDPLEPLVDSQRAAEVTPEPNAMGQLFRNITLGITNVADPHALTARLTTAARATLAVRPSLAWGITNVADPHALAARHFATYDDALCLTPDSDEWTVASLLQTDPVVEGDRFEGIEGVEAQPFSEADDDPANTRRITR